MQPVTFAELVMYATVRIATEYADGTTGVGTGFLFGIALDDGSVPLLITNKHVVDGAVKGRIALHLAKGPRPDGNEPAGTTYDLTIDDFPQFWTAHPNPEVDLCATRFDTFIRHAEQRGHHVFSKCVDGAFIWDQDKLEQLSAVENVIMIGYPIGLYDEAHNLPLIRSGITASHPAIDFNKEPLGVADVACFPGSSGSPIFLHTTGLYFDKASGNYALGGKRGSALLGVLFAGPSFDAEGELEVREIPTAVKNPTKKVPVPVTSQMIHLGYYIKAREVLAMAEHMKWEIARRLATAQPSTGPDAPPEPNA